MCILVKEMPPLTPIHVIQPMFKHRIRYSFLGIRLPAINVIFPSKFIRLVSVSNWSLFMVRLVANANVLL